MIRYGSFCMMFVVLCLMANTSLKAGQDGDTGIKIDKENRSVTIDAKIAPRKLDYLTERYPIEVIACWPHPKGKKAHETVVTIDAKPSDVHKALESLGLKPGTPVMGGTDEPQGPEVKLFLEVPGVGDETKKLSMDKVLTAIATGLPFPKDVKFRFTGSVLEQPDPIKPEKAYAADMSGTLIAIFPVTNQTVLQTNLTMKYESTMRLETNTKNLPPVGTRVKLIMQVPK